MKFNGTVLHIENKVTKEGKNYKVYHVLIKLDGKEFVRKFYIFS